VNAAVAEVDDLFGVTERPGCIDRRAGVAGISASGNIAVLERGSEFEEVDGSCESAVCETLELAVPVFPWHPDLDGDIGVCGGAGFRDDTAKRG
jgi:hypothetical protein